MTARAQLCVGWTLAIAVAALFVHLGLWQSGRADDKQRMLAEAARVLHAPLAVPLAAAHAGTAAGGYAWAAGHGHFAGPVLWLDNQQRDGRVGVRAYAVFQPDISAPLLVDMGWAPIPPDRRQLPALSLPTGRLHVRGLLAPSPSAGLALGPPMAPAGAAWLMVRVEPPTISRTLGLSRPLAPRVLRLDPALPYGLPRDLTLLANTLPPDKHRGYAVQWFGLAITVLVIALVLTIRGARR